MEWLRRFFAALFGRRRGRTAPEPFSFAPPPAPVSETPLRELPPPERPRVEAPPLELPEAPEQTPAEEPAVLEPTPEPALESEPETAPAVVVLEFELDVDPPDAVGEEVEALEEVEEDPDAPDPFISEAGASPVAAGESSERLAERRAEAMALALVGEHRLFLTDAAGPGTLAEALNRLLDEGRVRADYIDDGETPPHILYAPVLYAPALYAPVSIGSEGSELHSDIEPS